ncbi:glutathione S-transferase [Sphingomonas vulcanisoli]|uniref:Glutathione S-transferase n=1 Tax=Sphingomonas vulcanisoli TaxID=1658060 RepID=A0ABX0TMX9_9SPHN|nr:glutathione S-transferase family protein [Sphingomonas vulcanisoli]NIJ06883.1 glutathione S-transferase [Sphingomonas vulcanisoli]
MAELILYTNPMSRGRIARWMLEEVGQPYAVQYLGYGPEFPMSMKSPDYLAINPMGKVPALTHGDAVVTEGAAICAYLADAFPDAGLKPAPGTVAAAAYYRWLFYAAGPIEAAITDRSLGVTVTPEKARMVGYGSYDAVIDAIEAAVTGRPFIAGDGFTAADVYFGSQIGFGLQFGSMPERPGLRRYWEGLSQRPAYKRAAELDDAAIPKRD